jgi:pimeloyl-ACP methyl ester carboxylesterase
MLPDPVVGTKENRRMTFTRRDIELPQGTISVREIGSGPRTVVFVHGALVDGRLWDGVAERLAATARCVLPDLPLGSHRTAMRPDADLTPPGLARLVADLLVSLKAGDVTLVGNDTGGALCQLVAVSHPERVGRVVLTNCDAFEHFPPGLFKGMVRLARLPGGTRELSESMRIGPLRRGIYGLLTEKPIDDGLLKEWALALAEDAAVRRDFGKAVRAVDPRHTLDAAARLSRFPGPALLVWGDADQFFRIEEARRLAAAFGDAQLVTVPGGKTFLPVDRPAAVAEAIAIFMASPAVAAAA